MLGTEIVKIKIGNNYKIQIFQQRGKKILSVIAGIIWRHRYWSQSTLGGANSVRLHW